MTNQNSGQEGFTCEIYKIFKDRLIPIPLKLFEKFGKEKKKSKLIFKASINLILKTDKDIK